MGYVDDRRKAGSETRSDVDERESPPHRYACEARPFRGKAYGIESSTKRAAVQDPGSRKSGNDEHQQLRRQNTRDVTLSEKEKLLPESGVVLYAARQAVGNSSIE